MGNLGGLDSDPTDTSGNKEGSTNLESAMRKGEKRKESGKE